MKPTDSEEGARRQDRRPSSRRSSRRCCKEQFGLRMQTATQQLTNTAKLKQVRRNIARVRTLIHQKAKRGQA